jgi:hypothetical protein
MFPKEMTKEAYAVSSFTKLVLRDDAGGGAVYIEQGLTEGLEIEAEPELLRRIDVSVRRDTLYIHLGGTWLERLADKLTTSLTRPKIIYRLQVKQLHSAELACANELHITSLKTQELRLNLCGITLANVDQLEADRLQLKHSGMGSLQFSGVTRRQDVQLSGAVAYAAFELRSENADVSISGPAQAQVNVSQNLVATVRGMGCVEYRGQPHLRQQILGMGSIVRASA